MALRRRRLAYGKAGAAVTAGVNAVRTSGCAARSAEFTGLSLTNSSGAGVVRNISGLPRAATPCGPGGRRRAVFTSKDPNHHRTVKDRPLRPLNGRGGTRILCPFRHRRRGGTAGSWVQSR
jgi:hypothetical protein